MSTSSVYSYPTSYTTSGSISGTKYKNAIGKGADTSAASGNDYASGSSSSKAYIYYSFEFEIPENATIDDVECRVKGHLENTSKSKANLQLFAGSTAKGSASKFTSTSAQTVTLSTGTWTRSEIDDLKLRFEIGYYGGLVNGATVTITYTWSDVKYTVSVSGTDVVPSGDTGVSEGDSFTVKAYHETKPTVTDNGTDVSSQLVQAQDELYSVENVGAYGFELSNGYYINENKGISKSASLCKVNLNLPVSATVTITFRNYSEEGYDFGVLGNIDTPLNDSYYHAGQSGAEISDSSYKIACNTSTYNNTSYHDITYNVSAGEHEIYIKYSKDDASNGHDDELRFKVEVELSDPSKATSYWKYTIDSVNEAHTIIVSNGEHTITFYFKRSGSYVKSKKVWKKVNGTYIEVNELDDGVNYIFES